MPDTPTPTVAGLLTPELLQTVAEAVANVLAAGQQPGAIPPAETPAADKPDNPIVKAQPGSSLPAAELGNILAPVAAPLLAQAESRLGSRKLWVVIGTILTLLAQNPLGLNLSPATQIGVAAVAAIYVAAQAMVDGASKGGGK